MRRTAFAVITSGALAVAGCAQVPGSTAVDPTLTSTITQAQQATVALCGFLPAATTVAGILTKTNAEAAAGLAIGQLVAQAVCSAVQPASTAKSARYGAKRSTVYGVPVRGRFVR